MIQSAKQLPGHDIQVFIMPINPDNYHPILHMKGISGAASNSGDVILIQIDPSFDKDMLAYTVAHEYNHTVAIKAESESVRTILEMIILEGKADAFGKIVYPNAEVPWLDPLLEKELNNVVRTIKEIPHAYDYGVYTYLQQGTVDYPKWSNYKLGYAIMESYFEENPSESPEKWTKTAGEEIIKKSHYNQWFYED